MPAFGFQPPLLAWCALSSWGLDYLYFLGRFVGSAVLWDEPFSGSLDVEKPCLFMLK